MTDLGSTTVDSFIAKVIEDSLGTAGADSAPAPRSRFEALPEVLDAGAMTPGSSAQGLAPVDYLI
jgi:hypothetical protein